MKALWDSLQLLPIGALILLPGVLWVRCEAKFFVRGKLDQLDKVLSYLIYSLVAFSICYFVFQSELDAAIGQRQISFALALKSSAVAVGSGLLGGVLTGLSRRKDAIGKLFGILGIRTLFPDERAWVTAFSRDRGCLVRLTFKDGTSRFGLFGTQSLVSAAHEGEDIYLEQTFCEDPNGNLEPEVGSLGIWVSRSELSCVRLHSIEELDSDTARKQCQPRRIGSARNASSPVSFDGASDDSGSAGSRFFGVEGNPTDSSAHATIGADRKSEQSIEMKGKQRRGDRIGDDTAKKSKQLVRVPEAQINTSTQEVTRA